MSKKDNEIKDEYRPSPVYTYLRICSTFGITLAMNIYLLSHLLGGWLDGHFGTVWVFRMLLLLVALVSSFMYLWKRVVLSEKIEKDQKESEIEKIEDTRSLDERIEELKKGLKR